MALDSALGIVTVPGDADEPLGVRRLFGGLGLVDLDVPPPRGRREIAGMRIFAGYAGWSAGQLEGEIEAGQLVRRGRRGPRRLHPRARPALGSSVLRRQRGNLALVATFPEDPAMN